MRIVELITRVDVICKKYERYDVDKQRAEATNKLVSGNRDDAFANLFGVIETDIDQALQVKGLSKEELEIRSDLVSALKERIEAIPDGSTIAVLKQNNDTKTSAFPEGIKFNSSLVEGKYYNGYFQETEESNKFRQDYEMRRMRQDQGLDVIAEGLDTLKNMANDTNEELDRQAPLMDEIDNKVDRATSDLRNTNVKLKDTVTKELQHISTSIYPFDLVHNFFNNDDDDAVVVLHVK
ncbi:hypothetical protein ACH5RR_000165 [Cinchona calisaya]|uniref:t-SNARE coiled-coil homology domain-containing protein n=1 Tax=Cinchona calisaya TaxID=153742 RepID=A0ABD3B009_9GENT